MLGNKSNFDRWAELYAREQDLLIGDPDDWIDGFCKHLEIEALLEE